MPKKIIYFFTLVFIISCSKEGEKIPAFQLQTIDGTTISNKDLAGKITLINVWATWCHSCIEEIPELNSLQEKYKLDSSILFLALSDESNEKVIKFLDRKPFYFTHCANSELLSDALQTRLVKTYPQISIIGKDFSIKYSYTGELSNLVGTLQKEIDKLK